MREIHILVENLTGHDFQLKQVLSPEGGPRGSAPQVLERACKLSWTGEKNGGCALALEFHASRKRFVLAARLPGASWFPSRASHGGTISGIKFSAFVKELPANLSLARALQEAPDLEKHCVRDGCEWLAVRSTEKVLEMRVRLLPPEEQEVPAASERTEQLPAELLERDEAQLRRLRGFREMMLALDRQATELEVMSGKEPMDLKRLIGLPEKVKVDLALCFLAALLERRQACLARLPVETLPAEDSDPETSPAGRVCQVREALDSHVQKSFAGLVQLMHFEAKKEAKVRELAASFLKAPRSRYPQLDELCLAVQSAVADDSPAAWSADCWLPVGPEDVAAPLFSRLPLFGRALLPREPFAAALSTGKRWCPEEGCLVYSEEQLGVLYREGCKDSVFQKLHVSSKEQLEEELRARPACSSESKAFSTDRILPRAWLTARELLAVLLGAGAGTFDARSRAALLEMFGHLGIPLHLAASWESEIGGALFEALEASAILESQRASRSSWRKGKVAMAAAGGGLLMAITGGLAAPVVAPALAAGAAAVGAQAAAVGAAVGLAQAGVLVGGAISGLGVGLGAILTSLGTAGAVALFGATGAGMTGWKMSRRWGELEEFEFAPLETSQRLMQETVETDDQDAIDTLDSATRSNAGVLTEDVAVPVVGGKLQPLRKGSELLSRRTVLSQSSSERQTVRYEFQHKVDQVQRSVHLALFVSGWIHDRSDFRMPWMESAKVFFPRSGHMVLQWETKELQDVSAVFGQMITQEIASSTASFWLKSTAISTATAAGVAGSLAAMTVAWPVWIVSSMANLDNAWLVGVERARMGGKCLAHVLADRQTVGQRPVTLIGHSMGARLLVYCLCELYDMGEFHVVDDVVLLGTPVTTEATKWQKVRTVASGRVVNGYMGNDWVLAFLYRYLEWGVSVAGLSAVKVPGVENVNLDGLGIQGHHDYPRHIANILAKIRIGEQRCEVQPEAPKPTGAAFL